MSARRGVKNEIEIMAGKRRKRQENERAKMNAVPGFDPYDEGFVKGVFA